MSDAHKNFAYSTVATAPDPARYGQSLVVASGEGARFPTPPFNATIWPTGEQPTSGNAEIVRVTAINTDTFTIRRVQEDSYNRSIKVGDQIAATITNLTLTDAENTVMSWSPYIAGSGTATGLQTLYSATGSATSASMFVFPVTVLQDIRFNQIILANSLNLTSSAGSITDVYYSHFGIYSMNANTLSLISSNSFSIGETVQSVSASWYYPTTTHTTGYGYGSFDAGGLTATSQLAGFVSGTRGVGLQFGGNMKLSPDIYWIGLMSRRSTTGASNFGLNHLGIIGQVISPINSVGSSSGILPLGMALSEWSNSNTNSTAWFGRHLIGFLTQTTVTNYGGTAVPPAISLSQLGATAAASIASVLPLVTFVST